MMHTGECERLTVSPCHCRTVVEQYRLLHAMLQVVQEINGVTGLPLCNEATCPTMSAGR